MELKEKFKNSNNENVEIYLNKKDNKILVINKDKKEVKEISININDININNV